MALHHRSDNEEHFDICNNKQYRRAFKQENIYKHAFAVTEWLVGLRVTSVMTHAVRVLSELSPSRILIQIH